MPGGSSHDDHEIPAVSGAGIFHQIVDNFETVLARCFKAECRRLSRKGQIFVDGFGYVTHSNLADRELGHLTRRVHRIVTADGYQVSDLQSFQSSYDPFHVLGFFRRVGAGCVENRTAVEVNTGHVVVIEKFGVVGFSFHQVGKAIVDPHHLMTTITCLEGDGADGAVDPRSRPSANNYSNTISGRSISAWIIIHNSPSWYCF